MAITKGLLSITDPQKNLLFYKTLHKDQILDITPPYRPNMMLFTTNKIKFYTSGHPKDLFSWVRSSFKQNFFIINRK